MKKMLVIERCEECPHIEDAGPTEFFCDEANKIIRRVKRTWFPSFCPLPNYEGQEKKEQK
jgi:hypothetical protein